MITVKYSDVNSGGKKLHCILIMNGEKFPHLLHSGSF